MAKLGYDTIPFQGKKKHRLIRLSGMGEIFVIVLEWCGDPINPRIS